jgi:hypothetical protein
LGQTELIVAFLCIFILFFAEAMMEYSAFKNFFERTKWLQIIIYILMILIILMFGVFIKINFIYAQF